MIVRARLRLAEPARSFSAIALLAAIATIGPAASADPPKADPPKKVTQADRDAARALAEQGFEKFQQRKYADAIALFSKAEEHFHAPPHVAFIARAHEKRGELVEAADTYRRLLAEPLARDAPQPFRDAHAEAGPALASIERRIPKLRVDVAGDGADRARITASDRPMKPGVASPTNPGQVVVRLTADGVGPLERTVVLPESNAEVTVRFDLARPYSIAWPIAALTLGVAGGAAAIATGVLSHDKEAAADRVCAGMVECPQAQLDQMAQARTLRSASIGAGIAGGVFLAGGVTLFLLRRGPHSTVEPDSAVGSALSPITVTSTASAASGASERESAGSPSFSPSIALRVSPSFVGVTGSF